MFVALVLALGAGEAAAQERPAPEHQIQAAFLFHFTQFVTWPPRAFDDAQAPLVVGVLGEDPFGDYLDEVMRGEVVNGHPLEVRRYRSVEEAAASHILFIGRDVAERITQILPGLQRRPVLTVSEADDFAQSGGMIQFVEERGRIRFRINVEVARAAGLSLSSKLLRLADIVRTREG